MLCTYLPHLRKQSYNIIAVFASVKEQGDRKKDLSLYQGKVKNKTNKRQERTLEQ